MKYYEPSGKVTSLVDCMDLTKYYDLFLKIDSIPSISQECKTALKLLASRQIEFNYSKLADYYAKASSEVKDIMEDMHLVIVDTDRAIAKGYFKYFEDFDKLVAEVINEK